MDNILYSVTFLNQFQQSNIEQDVSVLLICAIDPIHPIQERMVSLFLL
jgi:hypothetical protein